MDNNTPTKRSLPFPKSTIVFVLLLLNFGLATSSAIQKSVTIDEFAILPNGLAILRDNAFQVDQGSPPLAKILLSLPLFFSSAKTDKVLAQETLSGWQLGYKFAFDNFRNYHHYFIMGRLVAMGALLATCLLTFQFSRSLYGINGGLLSLALVALSPNLLAHGRLATTDIFMTLAVIGSLWTLDSFARKPNLPHLLALGLTLGAACLVKFTGLLLLALLPITLLFLSWQPLPNKPTRPTAITLGLSVALLVALFTINAGFLFQGSFTPLTEYQFQSPPFNTIQQFLPDRLPVPLPKGYVNGLDIQAAETGYSAYLLGQFNHQGFPAYYLVGLGAKLPLPFLLFCILALLSCKNPHRHRFPGESKARNSVHWREIPLLTTGLLLFAFFSLTGHKNIGIRYLLFLIPLAAIWIGRLTTAPLLPGKSANRLVFGGLLIWMTGTTILAWPNYLPFFNRAVGGARHGHEYLLDSNLDWGQDLLLLKDYMRKEGIKSISLAYAGRVPPEIYGIPYTSLNNSAPRNHYTVISANLLWGGQYFVNGLEQPPPNRSTYAAYRRRKPEIVLGHTLYVYKQKISPPRPIKKKVGPAGSS